MWNIYYRQPEMKKKIEEKSLGANPATSALKTSLLLPIWILLCLLNKQQAKDGPTSRFQFAFWRQEFSKRAVTDPEDYDTLVYPTSCTALFGVECKE